MILESRDWMIRHLEHEKELMQMKIGKLSVRPPAIHSVFPAEPTPVSFDFDRPTVPSMPAPSLTEFKSQGSIIPPPPSFLFELPKRSVSMADIAPEPSPLSKRLASIAEHRSSIIPPPPRVGNLVKEFNLDEKPSEEVRAAMLSQVDDDWSSIDEDPPTLRSERSAVLAISLRPTALAGQ